MCECVGTSLVMILLMHACARTAWLNSLRVCNMSAITFETMHICILLFVRPSIVGYVLLQSMSTKH